MTHFFLNSIIEFFYILVHSFLSGGLFGFDELNSSNFLSKAFNAFLKTLVVSF